MTGLSDRDIRDAISQARKQGACIINVGEGYFYPTIDEYVELKKFVITEESRAMSILEGLKPLKAMLEDITRGRFDGKTEGVDKAPQVNS